VAQVKIVRDNRLNSRWQGRAVSVDLVPTPYPFPKQQFFKITATWPAKKLLDNPRVETVYWTGDFMTIMRKAQGKFVGAKITAQAIDTTPEWAKPKADALPDK
jgi:hypothetical protein